MTSRSRLVHSLDGYSRRGFLLAAARAAFGVAAVGTLAPLLAADPLVPLGLRRPARGMIWLNMSGGMSHLDTFDPKPGREVAGPQTALTTAIDGFSLAATLPLLAKRANRLAVVRSLSSNQGAHEQGQYFMRTGYAMRGTIRHPTLGSWANHLLGRSNPNLPGYVTIGAGSQHPGAGYFGAADQPLPIGAPDQGLLNSTRANGVSKDEFTHRLELLESFDQPFVANHPHEAVASYQALYADAVTLMGSRELAAFDLKREPQALRDAYGDSAFAQGCLLARRLIEHDVRTVEVDLGGWDTHDDNFERVADQAAILDRGLSALLDDLASRGLAEEVLVVVASEFGRTPRINQNQGRDHYPKAFSCMLAGGGIRGGLIHGATDEDGATVARDPVSIPDVHATIATALGLPLDTTITEPSGRPFTVTDKGTAIAGLLA